MSADREVSAPERQTTSSRATLPSLSLLAVSKATCAWRCCCPRRGAASPLRALPESPRRRRRGHRRLILLTAQRRVAVRVGARKVEAVDAVPASSRATLPSESARLVERHLLGAASPPCGAGVACVLVAAVAAASAATVVLRVTRDRLLTGCCSGDRRWRSCPSPLKLRMLFLHHPLSLLRELKKSPPRVPRGKSAMGCKRHATGPRQPMGGRATAIDIAQLGKEIPDRPMSPICFAPRGRHC